MQDVSPGVARAAERAAQSEWPRFFLLRFGEESCVEAFSLTRAAQLVVSGVYGDPVQVLEVSPDCAPRPVCEEVADAAALEWVEATGGDRPDDAGAPDAPATKPKSTPLPY